MSKKRGGGRMSKAKGSEYERKVCKLLSMWVSHMKRQDVFWRSAMSGGRATLNVGEGALHAHAGDIVATHALGNELSTAFCIDTKSYKDYNFGSLFFGSGGEFKLIWEKLVSEADAAHRRPMAVMKQNFKVNELVVLDGAGAAMMMSAEPEFEPHFILPFYDAYGFYLSDMLLIDFDKVRAVLKSNNRNRL